MYSRQTCESANGADIHRTDGVDRIRSDRYFTPLWCDVCDDMFPELADVSFMDARLAGYDLPAFDDIIVRLESLAA